MLPQHHDQGGIFGPCQRRRFTSFIHPNSALLFLHYEVGTGHGPEDMDVHGFTWLPLARVRAATLWDRGREALERHANGAAAALFEQALALAPELARARADLQHAAFRTGSTSVPPDGGWIPLLDEPRGYHTVAYDLLGDQLRAWPPEPVAPEVAAAVDRPETDGNAPAVTRGVPRLAASLDHVVDTEPATATREHPSGSDHGRELALLVVVLVATPCLLLHLAGRRRRVAARLRSRRFATTWWWELRLARAIWRHLRGRDPEARA